MRGAHLRGVRNTLIQCSRKAIIRLIRDEVNSDAFVSRESAERWLEG